MGDAATGAGGAAARRVRRAVFEDACEGRSAGKLDPVKLADEPAARVVDPFNGIVRDGHLASRSSASFTVVVEQLGFELA